MAVFINNSSFMLIQSYQKIYPDYEDLITSYELPVVTAQSFSRPRASQPFVTHQYCLQKF